MSGGVVNRCLSTSICLCHSLLDSLCLYPGGAASPTEDPQMSPKEKRVQDRKLKKERRKEEKQRLREMGAAQTPTAQTPARRSPAELALDYLLGWARKQDGWRFQKTRQTWLLVHMFQEQEVPDEHFSTLLAYLEGLQGQARQLTVQKAEALMQELDASGGPPARTQERARQVLQLLS
ncbi:uncharacterized protein C7orf50 homolog isoform X2 [Erinaceus europaeus]|uniref:Uncharacterized protein C7orf50 homolog isoform X2 n=1 Tax=Erinaceus europaeus TaxID=9365 RepID=A0ABM3VXY5_ERIEU|nr:uncharacterized protein C7orf50 homolog isoform X2 [Erinaceus europaeus]